MLDDLKLIAERDKSDAFGVAAKQAEQLSYTGYNFDDVNLDQPSNVVFGGMGGSALSGLIVKNWLNNSLKVPFEVVRDYSVPSFVGSKTLFIASSYSGNTEETISALHDAADKGTQIVVLAGGGKLKEIAESNNYPFLEIPKSTQPRMAVLYSVKIIAALFDHMGLTNKAASELEGLSSWLRDEAEKLVPTIGTSENQAKQIAEQLVGKSIVVYGGPILESAVYKWKISFNESSKNLAWGNVFSEFNHNEFIGWTSHPTEKIFGIVELQSDLDNPQIGKRFEVSNRLLSGQMPAPIIVKTGGDSKIKQILWTIQTWRHD